MEIWWKGGKYMDTLERKRRSTSTTQYTSEDLEILVRAYAAIEYYPGKPP
jgi:hypothetical protein